MGKDRITVQEKKLSELKMITGLLLLQNQTGLEDVSKHGRGVAGLEKTQSRAGSKKDCKSFDLQKIYHKKELDDLRTLY